MVCSIGWLVGQLVEGLRLGVGVEGTMGVRGVDALQRGRSSQVVHGWDGGVLRRGWAMLGLRWGYVEAVLGLCWGCVGAALGLCWGYVGAMLWLRRGWAMSHIMQALALTCAGLDPPCSRRQSMRLTLSPPPSPPLYKDHNISACSHLHRVGRKRARGLTQRNK